MEAILGIEIIKIVFLCSFLLVNTYYDIKYRQIFGTTKINCIIGIFAFSIIIYGYLENPNLDFFYIANTVCYNAVPTFSFEKEYQQVIVLLY